MTDPIPVVRTLNGCPYQFLGQFFVNNGNRPQHFSINPGRRTTIIGSRGTRLTILPHTFGDQEGRQLKEEVELRLTELFDQKEIVLSDKSTLSDDRLLETGGQFFLEAYSKGKPLQILHPLAVELPVQRSLQNPLGMRLYAGSASTTHSVTSGRSFDWKLLDRRPLKIRKIGAGKFFSFTIDNFHWFSVNHLFAKRATRTMVSVKTIAPVDELDEQAVFLLMDGINAQARMYASGNRFTLFNVPAKRPARIWVVGLRAGQLYFGERYIEKTSNRQVYVGLHLLSEAEGLAFFNPQDQDLK